ncbi:MAG: hypothetical protein FWG65_10335 [Turicibacter sp.]|nr:hypothetical protein [Turicibacter sp.]
MKLRLIIFLLFLGLTMTSCNRDCDGENDTSEFAAICINDANEFAARCLSVSSSDNLTLTFGRHNVTTKTAFDCDDLLVVNNALMSFNIYENEVIPPWINISFGPLGQPTDLQIARENININISFIPHSEFERTFAYVTAETDSDAFDYWFTLDSKAFLSIMRLLFSHW